MSEPYYSDDLVTLYHGDWRDYTDALGLAACMVIDPPYGIDYHSGSRRATLDASIVGDKDTTERDDALTWWGNRPALVFGTWRIARPAGCRARLIWDTKGALGMGDLSIPWKPSDQEIYVLGEGFAGPRDTNVLRYAPVQATAKNGRLHPHQKPVSLLSDLLRKCPPGLACDLFAGSGSLLVAAKEAGRPAVGVEIDERYCEIAASRCGSSRHSVLGEGSLFEVAP